MEWCHSPQQPEEERAQGKLVVEVTIRLAEAYIVCVCVFSMVVLKPHNIIQTD